MLVHTIDNLPPETVAMLQALYSRSPRSVHDHLSNMKDAQSFMSQYYVGYGHKSIGDCGSITLFVEGVSMLCAKAIQDWPLYSGQEASTRYLDMSKQTFFGPGSVAYANEIMGSWRSFYNKLMVELLPYLMEQRPRPDDVEQGTYLKAIRASAFDIARGFLPAGCSTYLSWHTNLRQCADHLNGLLVHPLAEVRGVGSLIQEKLIGAYPSSFRSSDRHSDYRAASEAQFAFEDGLLPEFRYVNNLDMEALSHHRDLLTSRPRGAELHHRFRGFGALYFYFSLDYGSFRDVQRQRSAVQPMPLLKDSKFHPWYLESLPVDLRSEAIELLLAQKQLIAGLGLSAIDAQYYQPMGYMVPLYLSCSLPSAVYIAELRSQSTVHPTLRPIARQMGDVLREIGVPCWTDDEESFKRGTQDIVKK